MKKSFILLSILFFLNIENTKAQSQTIAVDEFDKVIVSPHIQVTFKQGKEEAVIIQNTTVAMEKVNIEVAGKTLRIYLDDAKMVTKSKKVQRDNWTEKQPIYKGTIVTATVIYKSLNELSLRGEENFICESPLEAEKFRLKIYGASQVYLNEVQLGELRTTIYGSSYLEIKAGTIGKQKFTAYGESKVNTLEVANQATKVTVYGEGSFRFNVSEKLKVTAYGEAIVAYHGNPSINKGIIIGRTTIEKIR